MISYLSVVVVVFVSCSGWIQLLVVNSFIHAPFQANHLRYTEKPLITIPFFDRLARVTAAAGRNYEDDEGNDPNEPDTVSGSYSIRLCSIFCERRCFGGFHSRAATSKFHTNTSRSQGPEGRRCDGYQAIFSRRETARTCGNLL